MQESIPSTNSHQNLPGSPIPPFTCRFVALPDLEADGWSGRSDATEGPLSVQSDRQTRGQAEENEKCFAGKVKIASLLLAYGGGGSPPWHGRRGEEALLPNSDGSDRHCVSINIGFQRHSWPSGFEAFGLALLHCQLSGPLELLHPQCCTTPCFASVKCSSQAHGVLFFFFSYGSAAAL